MAIEYRVIQTNRATDLEHTLKSYGEDNWELVAVTQNPINVDSLNLFLMRKPILIYVDENDRVGTVN